MAVLSLQGDLSSLSPLPGVVPGPSFNSERKETPAEYDADDRDDKVEDHHYIVCFIDVCVVEKAKEDVE